MHHRQLIVIAGVLLLSVGQIFGQRPGAVSAPSDKDRMLERSVYRTLAPMRNELQISAVAGHLYYSEIFDTSQLLRDFALQKIEGTPKSDEYGVHYGARVWYRGRDTRLRSWINPSFSFLYTSRATYDGSSSEEIFDADGWPIGQRYYPLEGTKTNFFLDAKVLGGWMGQLGARPGRFLWVGAGLQGRLWGRLLGASMTEYYSWLNLPLSLSLSRRFNQIDAVELQLNGLVMLWGQMQIVYADEPCGLHAPAVELGKLPGGEVRFRWNRQLTQNTGFSLASFFEYYRFGRSPLAKTFQECGGTSVEKGTFFEPASQTFWVGLELGATWNW